jgi:hypothetical protein
MVKSSGRKGRATYLGPCLELCLKFCESIDLYLNICAWGVRLVEAEVKNLS